MRGLAAINRMLQEAGLGGLEALTRQKEATDSIVNVGCVALAISNKKRPRWLKERQAIVTSR